MARLEVLTSEQHAEWEAVLAQSTTFDFYHLPSYHRLAEARDEGQGHLFALREGEYTVAIPLLLRPIGESLSHTTGGQEWWDATSVYGYAGPVASHPDIPDPVLQDFRSTLREDLMGRRVVSVFSRLHPLISQPALLQGLGEQVPWGQTVSIDLTLPVEVQRAQYRHGTKRQINQLIRLGATCFRDEKGAHLDQFVDIYHETMHRAQAEEQYFFDKAYFEDLCATLGPIISLFVCEMDHEIMCGGLFTLCSGIVQAHLGGSRTDYSSLSPMKLMIDSVRLWANERGATTLHLGGGVGAKADSLFYFKAGFSEQRHDFCVWKWVLLPQQYHELCEENIRWREQHGLDETVSNYFPAYRRPPSARMRSRSHETIRRTSALTIKETQTAHQTMGVER